MGAPIEEVEKVRQIRAQRGDGLRPPPTKEQQAEQDRKRADAKAVSERIQGECAAFKSGCPTAWGIVQNFHRMVSPPTNYTGSECATWREGVRAVQDYLADQVALWEKTPNSTTQGHA